MTYFFISLACLELQDLALSRFRRNGPGLCCVLPAVDVPAPSSPNCLSQSSGFTALNFSSTFALPPTEPRRDSSPFSDRVTHRFYSQLQPVIVFISPSCPQVHKPLRSFSRLLLVLLMLPGSRKAFQLRVTCEVSPATLSGCAQRGCTVTSLTASTPTHTVRLFSSRNHAL